MRVCFGIMCEECERIHLFGHTAAAKHIQFTSEADHRPPYRLRCSCGAIRRFDKLQILPYRVSEASYNHGYAERTQYESVEFGQGPRFRGKRLMESES
jgi:hypothetical protein